MEITYELLFEALMLEKNRPELQKLDPEFYKALSSYIRDKKKILEENKGSLEFFSEAEKEKTSKQLSNIRKMIMEFYERREKKIIDMALTRSRTGSLIMDTSVLLEDEKVFFEQIVEFLDKNRGKTFSIIESKDVEFTQPKIQITAKERFKATRDNEEDDDEKEYGEIRNSDEIQKEISKMNLGNKKEIKNEIYDENKNNIRNNNENKEINEKDNKKNRECKEINEKDNNENEEIKGENEKINKNQDEQRTEEKEETTKMIRFRHAVPKFLGKELEVYGPFEEEDIATIPSDIAEVIIRKGRAEEIK